MRADGPSAQAGLKQNDVLLVLADKPLAAAEDLTKQLKAAGEAAVPLKVLRAGQPITLQVRPVYRVTLGPVAERKTEYYIGVSIEGVDDALRSQLALPAGQGVVVTEVLSGSPAEKVGVKKYDVVLELAAQPIDRPETLARQVQANQEKPVKLKLVRSGKPVTFTVTGAVRKAETSPQAEAARFWLVDRELAADPRVHVRWTATEGDGVRQKLDQLEKELKALRAAMDDFSAALKAEKARKRD
jgi:serine protease Do